MHFENVGLITRGSSSVAVRSFWRLRLSWASLREGVVANDTPVATQDMVERMIRTMKEKEKRKKPGQDVELEDDPF